MNTPQNHSIESDALRIEQWISETPELAAARDYGVDVWALIANLHRTPQERIRRHETALSVFKVLYQKGR